MADSIRVMIDDAAAWVRVQGRGQFSDAHALRQFAARSLSGDRTLLCVDLGECVSLDSTFIGTLVMLVTEEALHKPVIRLLNVRENVREQLDDLGVSRLFEFDSPDGAGAPRHELQSVNEPAETRRSDLTRTTREAHEALARLSPANERKFKDLLSFLREEENQAQ